MSCRVDLAKAPRHHRCSRQHRELVDGYWSAVAAQEARAEEHSHGYGTGRAGEECETGRVDVDPDVYEATEVGDHYEDPDGDG